MTSSCLTFDLRYDLNIQCIQSVYNGHAHVQISGLYYEGNKCYTFSMIESELHANQINTTLMYNVKLSKIQVTSIFS